jgi:hypothetical protein
MSEVKVNKISPRTNCGTTQLGDAGDTITVTGDLKSNSIKSASGSTITLGQSGDTIQLGCGASQTGFGRTGTVDWDTTAKTASFTAVSGNGYFVNTTSGAITVTLPAGSAGDIVGISDYASTFQTNNVTITPNGTDKINGENASATLSTQGLAVSLVYVDSTRGWKSVTGSDNDTSGVTFISATGGTITTCGDYKIHTFTGPGTFCVSSLSTSPANNLVDYLVVGGGGGGGGSGGNVGGGAGGGAVMVSATTYSGPSLANCVAAHPVSVQAYPITIGAGGIGGGCGGSGPFGLSGNNSIFSSFIAAGGGRGGCGGEAANPTSCGPSPQGNTPSRAPGNGSGGGSAEGSPSSGSPGGANGNPGGNGQSSGGGGGGGGAAGAGGPSPGIYGGSGGTGDTITITGTPAVKGAGGSGSGEFPGGPVSPPGPANSGEGGSGSGFSNAGGSGIVVIRYKYQ